MNPGCLWCRAVTKGDTPTPDQHGSVPPGPRAPLLQIRPPFLSGPIVPLLPPGACTVTLSRSVLTPDGASQGMEAPYPPSTRVYRGRGDQSSCHRLEEGRAGRVRSTPVDRVTQGASALVQPSLLHKAPWFSHLQQSLHQDPSGSSGRPGSEDGAGPSPPEVKSEVYSDAPV